MSACPTCGATYDTSVKICPKDGTVLERTEAADRRLGETLDGKYRLDSRLGQGGMGAIYKATHLMLDKQVAVKLIKPELVTSSDLVRRFQREARAAGNLNHPNIAAVYDLGQTPDGTLYIAMELVNGPSLKDVIRTTGPIERDRCIRIVRQIASALSLAHRHNIVHRDLKPHNVMLATDRHHENAKLLDFGIAKTFDEASTQLTQTGFVLGTPQYMSPEQAAGRPIDGRSDLYSLGIILYEMLIGEVPFNDPSTPAVLVKHLTEIPAPPSRRRPDVHVPADLEALALRLLEKEPERRFQSADEFLMALPVETGTATAAVAPPIDSAKTVVLPAAGVAGAAAASQVATAAMPAGDATVVTPPPVSDSTKTMPPTAPRAAAAPPPSAVTATAPAAPVAPPPPAPSAPPASATAPAPAATSAGAPAPASVAPLPSAPSPGAARPSPPPSAPPPPPSVAAAQPQPRAAAAASAGRESRPLRDIVVLVAILLVVVGGVGFGAMRLGLFGGTAEAPAADEPMPAADTTPAVPSDSAAVVQPAAPAPTASSAPAGRTPAAPPAAAPANAPASAAAAPRPAPSSAPPAAPQAEPVAAAPALPETPAVFFQCAGAAQICSALRGAMTDAFGRYTLRPVANAATADVTVAAEITLVDESAEQVFGTTVVNRTYSIELTGSARGGDLVAMPVLASITYDAALGQQKLAEESRRLSMSAAERVRTYWRGRRAN